MVLGGAADSAYLTIAPTGEATVASAADNVSLDGVTFAPSTTP